MVVRLGPQLMVVCTNSTLLGTTVFDEYSHVAGEKALSHSLQFYCKSNYY